jgi:hypothetical protein
LNPRRSLDRPIAGHEHGAKPHRLDGNEPIVHFGDLGKIVQPTQVIPGDRFQPVNRVELDGLQEGREIGVKTELSKDLVKLGEDNRV